jgi:putative PIG3 family NAD(P)H quinone oxidoreductase
MKAVYITEFGPPENLEVREMPDPVAPTGTQVLVRVGAAGLNRADLLQARGLYPPPPGYSPNIPGLEFAGEVAETGADVTAWTPGERVFGITAGEAQAEFVVTDQTLLTKVPDDLSLTEAAAVPEAFITAHDAIFTLGELTEDETLLIHAVGSGVGLSALQLAKARGSRVVGTSRTADKLEKCAPFGLDAALLTGSEADLASRVMSATSDRGVDCILDLVGAAYFAQNLASLAPKGRLVLVGLTSGAVAEFDMRAALQKRATIIGTVMRPRSTGEKAEATRRFADEVVPLLASGTIRPNLDRVFAAGDVIAAYKYLESNVSFGKVVLEF